MIEKDMPSATAVGGLMAHRIDTDDKHLLIGFVSRGKGEQLAAICRSHQGIGNIIIPGRGTARSEIMEYLGLELDKKDIVLSHVKTDRAQELLQDLRGRLELDRPGKGIAILMPIMGSKGFKALFRLADQMDKDNAKAVKPADPRTISDAGISFYRHELVIAVLHGDIVDEAVGWAVKAGAAGGTVLHSRYGDDQADDTAQAMSLLFTEPGADIILMLVEKAKVRSVIESLDERLQKRAGRHILLSLPVSAAVGLSRNLVVMDDGSVKESASSK